MKLLAARDEFALRLYVGGEIFLRELETECPKLSLIGQNNRSVGGIVSWNKTLSSLERAKLAKALTVSSHINARTIKGISIDNEIKFWLDKKYIESTIHKNNLPPLRTSDLNFPDFQPISVDECLVSAITGNFGITAAGSTEELSEPLVVIIALRTTITVRV